MLRMGSVQKRDFQEEGNQYTNNSTPQFQRALTLVIAPILKRLSSRDLGQLSILDVGCGTGEVANYLAKQGFQSIMAFDISVSMINTAQSKYDQPNLTFVVADACNFDMGRKFNILISTSVLQWVPNNKIESAFSSMMANLQVDGELIFLVPTYDFPHQLIKDKVAFTPKWRDYFVCYKEPQSLTRSLEDYQRILNKAGFVSIELEVEESSHSLTPDEFMNFTKLWCGCFHILEGQLKEDFEQDVLNELKAAVEPGMPVLNFKQVSIVARAKRPSMAARLFLEIDANGAPLQSSQQTEKKEFQKR